MAKKSIVIGSDHAGFRMKQELKTSLIKDGFTVIDDGTHSDDPVDYPDIARKVAYDVLKYRCFGILICGSGIGMSIVANKVKGVRAGLCINKYMAEMAREHNDANVLCLGARIIENAQAITIAKRFLETETSKEERHQRRINNIEPQC